MDDILNPTVFLGSFEWREPVTTLTDFLVAFVALAGFIKFNSYKQERTASFIFFQYYFLCFAIGMASAAWLGHGLQAYVGPEFKRIGWVFGATGLLLFGLGSFVEVKSYVNRSLFSVFKTLFIAQYLFFVFLMLNPTYSDFIYAQLSSTISLIAFILPLNAYNLIRSKSRGSLLIVLTICYSIIPGLIYNNQISVSRWFNYHDISHVLMAIFMVFMIQATSRLTMIKKKLNYKP
jgi:hypothetical protein